MFSLKYSKSKLSQNTTNLLFIKEATLVDNKLVVFWLNLLLECLSENTSGWLQTKKKYLRKNNRNIYVTRISNPANGAKITSETYN